MHRVRGRAGERNRGRARAPQDRRPRTRSLPAAGLAGRPGRDGGDAGGDGAARGSVITARAGRPRARDRGGLVPDARGGERNGAAARAVSGVRRGAAAVEGRGADETERDAAETLRWRERRGAEPWCLKPRRYSSPSPGFGSAEASLGRKGRAAALRGLYELVRGHIRLCPHRTRVPQAPPHS